MKIGKNVYFCSDLVFHDVEGDYMQQTKGPVSLMMEFLYFGSIEEAMQSMWYECLHL